MTRGVRGAPVVSTEAIGPRPWRGPNGPPSKTFHEISWRYMLLTAHTDADAVDTGHGRALAFMAGAFLLTAPWIVLNVQGIHPNPLITSALTGRRWHSRFSP